MLPHPDKISKGGEDAYIATEEYFLINNLQNLV